MRIVAPGRSRLGGTASAAAPPVVRTGAARRPVRPWRHPAIEAGVRGLVSDGSSPESRSLDPGASDLLGPTAGHDRAPTSLLDANASVVFDRAKGRTARQLVTLWLPGQLADGRAGSYRERPPPLTDVLASAVAEAHVDCVGRGGVAGHNVLK